MADNRWKGVDEAMRKMRGLAPALQKKALKAAVRKGALVVRDAARANARAIDDPSTPESIPANIAVQFSNPLSKREGGVGYRVGVQGGAKMVFADNKKNRRKGIVGQQTSGTNGSTWYWRFLELGTSQLAARPFMRPALENNIDRAIGAVVAELNPQIDKQLAKLK